MTGRRRLFKALQIAVAIVLLGAAVWIAQPSELWRALEASSVPCLLLSLLFVPLLIMLKAARWHILSRSRRRATAFASSLHSYMGGLALAVITPLAAGELARGAFAAPGDKAAFVGLTLLDKLIDATVLFFFACVGFILVTEGPLRGVGVGALALLAVGWLAARPIAAFAGKRFPQGRISRAAGRALEAAGGVTRSTLAVCFLLATVGFALYYCQLYIIMYAFAPTIEWKAVGLFPFITLSRLIPSPAGLGVREFTAGALFAHAAYQVKSPAAVLAAFTQFVTVNVLPVAVWILFFGGFARFISLRRGGKVD